jgi:uncharacterized protein YbjT (DUF2867 family)
MAELPILVLGATGGQGGAVADALLAHGARVRVMVRRPGEPKAWRLAVRGVEVLSGSLDDRAALGAAMRGVDAVFALTTPFEAGVDAEIAQGRAIAAAAANAQVPHLVFSSVAGANQHTGVPHFDSKAIIEDELAASALSYTITAPTYFFARSATTARPAAAAVGTPRPRRICREGAALPRALCRPTGGVGQRRRHAGANGRGTQRGGGPTGAV